MTIIQSKVAKGTVAYAVPDCSGDAIAKRFAHTLSANPTAGDILEIAVIPAGCRVIDIILDSDDLDSNGSPTIACDVGIMSGEFGSDSNSRTCGAEFFSASNLAQAGGVSRATIKTAFRTGVTDYDRSIGIKFTTAAATFASGEIGVTVICAAD